MHIQAYLYTLNTFSKNENGFVLAEGIIYTDGACSGNPGPGGWGAVLFYKDSKKEISGFLGNTTNNIMEMTAVIEALNCLKTSCKISLYSDSKYVITGITQWIYGWMKKNWVSASGKPVKNKGLWKEIFNLSSKHEIKWFWVKGHSDNEWNERCDYLARKEIKKHTNTG